MIRQSLRLAIATWALAAASTAALAQLAQQSTTQRKQPPPSQHQAERPVTQAAQRASMAPLAVRINCIGDSYNGHARWGGSNLAMNFDEKGRAQLVLRPRIDTPYSFSVCWDYRHLENVQFEPGPGLNRGGVSGNGRWIVPQSLPGERGSLRSTVRLTGTRLPQGPAEVAVPFDVTLDVTIEYITVPDMQIAALEREDYRPGRRGSLRNQGVLDPGLLQGPDQSAGRFTLIGRQLIGSNTTVTAGGSPVVIEQRSSAAGEDRLVVAAQTLGPGSGIVVQRGEFASPPFPIGRRTYRSFGPQDIANTLGSVQVVLGSPQGAGQVAVMGTVEPLQLDPVVNQDGLKLDLTDLRSRGSRASFSDAGEGRAQMLLEIEFESGGDELQGTLLQQIDVFRCGGYTIERARCGTIDGACLRRMLGAAFGGAGQCTNPAAWAAQRVAGPNRPARGQIADAKLMVWIDLAADERSGNTVGTLRRVEFHSKLSLDIEGAALPMSAESIQLRLRKEIERRLFEKLAERQLSERIADGVHRGVIVNIARPLLRGYYALPGGQGLFADIAVGSP